MSNGFGKANLNPQYDGPKYFKLRTPDPRKNETETSLVLRLLPSMHSYRDTGQWKFYYGQHYGYAGVNSRDPSKPRARPFGCIQKKNKQKEIVTSCPKCTQIAQFEAKKTARENELAKANGIGETKEERQTPEFYEAKKGDKAYQALSAWLSKHNCDKKFWINAMDREGNFGMLQLSYTTCEEKLMPLLNKLASGEETGEKVDAFDPAGGMWLKFSRTGKAPRVQDAVSVYEELVDLGGGKKAKAAVAAPMTQEQIEKALKTCKDLKTDVVKFIDVETMQKLVDCSGDPEEVDSIWPPEPQKNAAPASEAKKAEKAADEIVGDEDLSGEDNTPPAGKVETKTETKSEPAPAEDDEEAIALKAVEAARAKKAAKAAEAAKANGTSTLGKTVDNPDDFLSQFDAK
jgi:hypothetical protein